MSAAPDQVSASVFVEEQHPRSSTGQFGTKSTTKQTTPKQPGRKTPARKAPARKSAKRRVIPKGQLGFDGVSGTGYGMPHGDARVKELQAELNRLGLTDMHGRRLAVDGKLGPLTTSAIRKAQRRLGMKATGIVDPSFIARLRSTKAMPKPAPAKRARRTPAKRAAHTGMANGRARVSARFDPTQKRDENGKWTKIGAAIHAISEALGSDVKAHEDFGFRSNDGDGDPLGFVALHDDGAISINSYGPDGKPTNHTFHFADEEDLDGLLTALEDGEDGEGDTWQLTWVAKGPAQEDEAVLNSSDGESEPTELRMDATDADQLAAAVRDMQAQAGSDDLAAVKPLRPDETLDGKKKFGSSEPLGVAAVDGPDGRTVRLAPIGWLDPNENGRGLKFYTGGEGRSSAVLDQKSATDFREELDALSDEAGVRLTVLDHAYEQFQADGDKAAYDAAIEPYLNSEGQIDGLFGNPHEVETPWGTLVAQIYSNEAGEWGVHIGVRPHGAVQGKDWSLDGYTADGEHVTLATAERGYQIPHAELEPKDVKALIKYLGSAFTTPVAAASPVTAAELRGIELARPGKWKLASGEMTFTEQMLHDAARYARRPGARPAHVKIGHVDPRFDGEPALGWVDNVRVEDRDGMALVGDITDMPDWLAAAARKHWPYRSIEGWADFTADDGEKYGLVLEGLALLGVTPPGVSTIQSLRDLPKAVGIAAATGVRVVASMASAPVAAEEGAGQMDPAKTRDALGLAADASDEEVRSAMSVALQSLGGDAGPAQQPVQASLFGDEPTPAPAKQQFQVPPGMKLVTASAYDEREETIKKLMAFVEQSQREKRDDVIAQAVRAGKFTPAQKPNFVKLWDADPEGTHALIDSLTPNSALAVMASGYAGEVDDASIDAEYRQLFGPITTSKGA